MSLTFKELCPFFGGHIAGIHRGVFLKVSKGTTYFFYDITVVFKNKNGQTFLETFRVDSNTVSRLKEDKTQPTHSPLGHLHNDVQY